MLLGLTLIYTSSWLLPSQPPAAEMVFIQGGAFHMGDVFDDNVYRDDKPVHRVALSDFYLATHELTFTAYEAFCRATGRPLPDPNGWGAVGGR
jgi:formylglycine-generating enzyme required for sulfatase activity